MDWKILGRKLSLWHNLRHYPGIFLEELRKITKTLRPAGVSPEVRTSHL
jgi:hypothetical protein